MWCMNSFLESSDCTLQGTCSVTSHECVTCTVDVDIYDYYYRCRYRQLLCALNPGHEYYNKSHICIAVFYDCAA